MDTKAVGDRIAARKKADEVIEICDGETFAMTDDQRHKFWETIRKTAEKEAPRPPDPPKPIEPFSDERAKLFEGEVMPWGKHRGSTIGTIAAIDPGYLLWLQDQPDEFKDNLKRYLENPGVSRELQGDD